MNLMALWMKWHRQIGWYVAPILLMLAITGILINHSQDMDWHETPVYSETIGALYGVQPQQVVTGFSVRNLWISQLSAHIYLDSQSAIECKDQLHGAVEWDETIALLCGERIHLMTFNGELVESLDAMPGVNRLGLTKPPFGALAIASSQCDTPSACYFLDPDSWEWQPLEEEETVSWSTAQALPDTLKNTLNQNQPLPGISRERFMLDLHSGRLFGQVGIWVVDFSGVLMLVLVITGMATRISKSLRKPRRKTQRKP